MKNKIKQMLTISAIILITSAVYNNAQMESERTSIAQFDTGIDVNELMDVQFQEIKEMPPHPEEQEAFPDADLSGADGPVVEDMQVSANNLLWKPGSRVDPRLVGAVDKIEKPKGWSPMPDYAGLTEDGKLDIRIFMGYDEDGNDQKVFTAVKVSLQNNGWTRVGNDMDMPVLLAKSLKIGNKTVDATVSMSLGRSLKFPAEVLIKDLKHGEVTIYNGHSTHGSGLAAGNEVMVRITDSSFSQENKNQLLFIASCESEQLYEKKIRSATSSRDPKTMDLLLTTRDTKYSEYVSRLLYSIEEEADLDEIARAVSLAHGSSFLWDKDTAANDLFQDQITYDTRRDKPAVLTPDAILWGLANGELHLHLRAIPEKVNVPGHIVPADFPKHVENGMESLWRRLVISNSANERTEWRKKLTNAVEEIDKILINCKDNKRQFAWDSGSPIYDQLMEIKKTYTENIRISREPASIAKVRNILVPRWLAENDR